MHWYSAGESIGIYPVGLSPDGSKSAYAGNLHSKGILIGALKPVSPKITGSNMGLLY
ncbi:MAG: hypothetical protein IPJ82_22975 [Lewinellaceae bacterium]|nr:hypothetical protein [Lewinellaceae bacterium]